MPARQKAKDLRKAAMVLLIAVGQIHRMTAAENGITSDFGKVVDALVSLHLEFAWCSPH